MILAYHSRRQNYVTPLGQVSLDGLWTTRYPRHEDAIAFFQSDYPRALIEAKKFDAQLRKDAERVSGSNYAAIVELSTRQAFATFELTTGVDEDWKEDKTKSMAWLKEISSNGDMSVRSSLPLIPSQAPPDGLLRSDDRCYLPSPSDSALHESDTSRITPRALARIHAFGTLPKPMACPRSRSLPQCYGIRWRK